MLKVPSRLSIFFLGAGDSDVAALTDCRVISAMFRSSELWGSKAGVPWAELDAMEGEASLLILEALSSNFCSR